MLAKMIGHPTVGLDDGGVASRKRERTRYASGAAIVGHTSLTFYIERGPEQVQDHAERLELLR